MFEKRNKVYVSDSYLFGLILSIIFFTRTIHVKSFKSSKKYSHKTTVYLFLLRNTKAIHRLSIAKFHPSIISVRVYCFKKINILKIRDAFHKKNFNEIATNHLFNKTYLSTYIKGDDIGYLVSGDTPGNPTYSCHFNPINIFKYASDEFKIYPWVSVGKGSLLNEKFQLVTSGVHLRWYPKTISIEKNKQITDFIFSIKKNKSSRFSIRFNTSTSSLNTYDEAIFLHKNGESTLTFTSVLDGKLSRVYGMEKIESKYHSPNFLRIIFDKKCKKLFLFTMKRNLHAFGYNFTFFNNFQFATPQLPQFRSFNYSLELSANFSNTLHFIKARVIK